MTTAVTHVDGVVTRRFVEMVAKILGRCHVNYTCLLIQTTTTVMFVFHSCEQLLQPSAALASKPLTCALKINELLELLLNNTVLINLGSEAALVRSLFYWSYGLGVTLLLF